MSVLSDVGQRLVRFRAQAGLEPEAAAAAAGIDAGSLEAAEMGELPLSEEQLAALARVYGIDVTELFGGRITPFRDYAAGG